LNKWTKAGGKSRELDGRFYAKYFKARPEAPEAIKRGVSGRSEEQHLTKPLEVGERGEES
jgi:hypothetical protein